MAHVVMAQVVMAGIPYGMGLMHFYAGLYSYGSCSYGLYSYGYVVVAGIPYGMGLMHFYAGFPNTNTDFDFIQHGGQASHNYIVL